MIKVSLKKTLKGNNNKIDFDISFDIEDKKFIVIFGKSGAGKTSFIRMLAGLLNPDFGYISVNNNIWYDSQNKINLPTQKRKIGYVFQDYALFPNMTVRENLDFALNNKKERNYIDEILNIVNLLELSDRKPDTLSGGQKQRVALARALVRKPEILLLDEPLSSLDLEMRLKLQNELYKIHKTLNITTIMITHDIGETFRLANLVFCIDNGKIIKQGKPSDVFVSDNISGKFKFTGEIIDIKKSDVVNIVTVLVQNNIIKVIATDEELENIKIGENVIISSKAFNPLILKI
ncbi:MAG: ATP-binding cassette domain-containing protein [Candidatus Sericytochromatia bacterium]